MPSIFRPGEAPSVLPIKAVPAVDTWLIESGYGPSPDYLYHACELHGVHFVSAFLDGGQYILELKPKRDGSYTAKEKASEFLIRDGDTDLIVSMALHSVTVARVPKGKYTADECGEFDVPEGLCNESKLMEILSAELGFEDEYLQLAKAQVEASGKNWEEVLAWVRAQNPLDE